MIPQQPNEIVDNDNDKNPQPEHQTECNGKAECLGDDDKVDEDCDNHNPTNDKSEDLQLHNIDHSHKAEHIEEPHLEQQDTTDTTDDTTDTTSFVSSDR